MNFQDVLCKLGFHRWNQSKSITLYDMSPSPLDSRYKTPKRKCKACKKEQKWIPGYGGSEIGCWI